MRGPFLGFAATHLLAALASITCAGIAPAQVEFNAISLHSSGWTRSFATGAAGSIQAGYVRTTQAIPAIWRGTPESAMLLDARPFGWVEAQISSTTETYQVGHGIIGDVSFTTHAIMWKGTPESIRDINPAGFHASHADEVSGNQIVGNATKGNVIHAGLWRASDGAFTDLHPTGALSSGARATDGVRQAGAATFPNKGNRGLIWNGSKDDYIDITPSGALETGIQAMTADTQVGWVRFGGNPTAALWHNSAASFVNMAPANSVGSVISATLGDVHAGYAIYSGPSRATLWAGDDPSVVLDLHALLTPDYSASEVYALANDGETYYAAGIAVRNGREEAMLWVGTVPAPGAFLVIPLAGLVTARHRRSTARALRHRRAARAVPVAQWTTSR